MTIWPSLILIVLGFAGILASSRFDLGTVALLVSALVMGFGGLTFLVIWARGIES